MISSQEQEFPFVHIPLAGDHLIDLLPGISMASIFVSICYKYREKRFELGGNGILINGKGNLIADSSPLLTVPSDHDYMAQVELEITGNATGDWFSFTTKQRTPAF